MSYKPETISDIARLAVYEDLCAALKPLGYDIELSSISIRIYKSKAISAILWLYPNDIKLSLRIGGPPVKFEFTFDDPKFFDKVKDAVLGYLHKA